jgi:eukaryotic-like serine/threonine-protein kinase
MNEAMTPERWGRVKALFAAALEVPVGERAALLEREAGDDLSLVTEVASLLASHEQPGEFMESAPTELRAEALGLGPRGGHIGERIGAYRIVEMIGVGGMGDVYKAVRDDDQYRAEVAIKLMRADVRNPLSEQRFKSERQILASLDHRNIARLLDGGTTPGGLPYVVMELVTGLSIDKYCDEKNLSVRERVQIFLQVCAAVTYAHQHLVVHRDLKPNNIFVAGDGSVKLLDFGIAKLLEAAPVTGTNTEETRTQLRAMTLEYASPEQVSGGTVTTVSDVYSLGVVLYRLITGHSPYRATGGDAARVAEILSDTSPTRPSQVSSATATFIDSDLDHVLLMALRKEPQKRYGSVEQFANDLRNYLGGRPVQARRGTLGYRVGKFVRRNKVPIGAAVLVSASLVGGLGFAIHEAREAERQRAVAQRHFDSVRSLANKLIDFNEEIKKLDNSTKAQEILVTTSLQYLDTLYQEAGNDLALREELGVAYRKVGDIQGGQMDSNRGDPKAALATYAKSNDLLESLLATNPGNVRVAAFLCESYMRQARTLFYTEGPKPALAAADRGIQLCESSRKGFESEALHVATLGDSYAIKAQITSNLGRYAEAMASVDKLIRISEEFTRANPENEMGLRGLAKAYINAAITDNPNESGKERLARGEPLFRKAMAVQERLVALDPARFIFQWNLAETQFNLGDALYDGRQYAAALDLFRKASVTFSKYDPNDARGELINSMNEVNLAKSLVKTRHFTDAETVLTRVEPVLLKSFKEGRTVQNEYFLGVVGLQRGLIALERAKATRDAAVRTNYLRQARATLRESAGYFENANKTIELTGVEKEAWDETREALANAEAGLAGAT